MTILSRHSRLRDENWTWVLPTTQHEYQLFRLELELEMMEERSVYIVVTERLSTSIIDKTPTHALFNQHCISLAC